MHDMLIRQLLPVLRQAGLLSPGETEIDASLESTEMGADGSSRRFVRIRRDGQPLCLAVFPATGGQRDLDEANSAWHIGRHLRSKGIAVPLLYGRQESTGVILFEDLGDLRLHEIAAATDFSDSRSLGRLLSLYGKTLDQLVAMQLGAIAGFSDNWCYDTARYDRQLMLARESGYFLQAFWQDTLNRQIPEGIERECTFIADQASLAPSDFFLHRDFQSRNIMITEGCVRIIDYQAGRRGPLAYDLASLLIDPYAALPKDVQEQLLQIYIDKIGGSNAIKTSEFRKQYTFLALQRNLQIIGAFAYLSKVHGKDFFAGYIHPAIRMLHDRLQDPVFGQCSNLKHMAATAMETFER